MSLRHQLLLIHFFLIQNTFRTDAHLELNQFRRKQDCALVVSGESLEVCLQYYQDEFMELATASPAVVCCRCSPTQKAQVVSLIQKHTGKRACAVGDGGNDVSMIQQSDAGINSYSIPLNQTTEYLPLHFQVLVSKAEKVVKHH